ncbi:M23 family peptidase [Bradyrhizobium sp.]|uniref:M23 family peptidase n=1 Tax=Bradyrhizobium sp. TaxID=376 RepID=UPI004037D11A
MGKRADRFVLRLLAVFLLQLAGGGLAAADQFHTPSVSAMRVEWRTALDQLRTEVSRQPVAASTLSFAIQQRYAVSDPRSMPALVQLNAITSQIFNGIGRSPIPVLLPFDAAAWLEARPNGAPDEGKLARFQAEFRTDLFHAGLSGYDATFSLPPATGEDLPHRTFARPVEVQITGSLLVYDLADPAGGKGEPVKSLAAQFPDMRRFIREGYVRYAFTKFGVPYVVSIQCLDSAPRARRLACREAYPIAERFLKALQVAGGLPSRPRKNIASLRVERPVAASAEFTYRPSGDIIAKTGSRRQSGHADNTAYSQIRFPLVRVPVAIRSQSFARRDKTRLIAGTYPWRDNFCEARSFNVGQCASGFGHQGQDLRPRPCSAEESAEGCDDKRQAIVAVRDGVVIRAPKQQAATLQVNTRTEHIRFRYMHMNPSAMDADGLLNGRRLIEGEPIGVVSNYLDRPNGTSRHLHFDVQVFTRDGWLWVNPYTTLVSAYERLIGGRGRRIGNEPVTAAAVAQALPAEASRPGAREAGAN